MFNLIPDVEAKAINRWMNNGSIDRGFSFTKKGPGRKHNNTGTDSRFIHLNINDEFDARVKYGRISDSFIKRWVKYSKTQSVGSKSFVRKMIMKFAEALRRK